MQQDAGQEQNIVEDGGDLETAAKQPADFEDMLMKPALNLAEDDKQQRERRE